MSFDRAVDKVVRRRRWQDVAGLWLNDIPEIVPSGKAPEGSLRDLVDLSYLPETSSQPSYGEIPGLRKAVLHEAIFLLHKCSHVVSKAEVGAASGRLTWSLSDAYHGAFFGAKAILGFLGLGFIEFDSSTVFFNIWPVRPENEQGRRKGDVGGVREIIFVQLTNRIEHRHIWTIFSRALRVYAVPEWPPKLVKNLGDFDARTFARQRNLIHYSNHQWFEPDLHEEVTDNQFGVRSLTQDLDLEPNVSPNDFSLSLGLAMLQLGRMLLDGITSRVLDGERSLFVNKLEEGWHPLFNHFFYPDGSLTHDSQ